MTNITPPFDETKQQFSGICMTSYSNVLEDIGDGQNIGDRHIVMTDDGDVFEKVRSPSGWKYTKFSEKKLLSTQFTNSLNNEIDPSAFIGDLDVDIQDAGDYRIEYVLKRTQASTADGRLRLVYTDASNISFFGGHVTDRAGKLDVRNNIRESNIQYNTVNQEALVRITVFITTTGPVTGRLGVSLEVANAGAPFTVLPGSYVKIIKE